MILTLFTQVDIFHCTSDLSKSCTAINIQIQYPNPISKWTAAADGALREIGEWLSRCTGETADGALREIGEWLSR